MLIISMSSVLITVCSDTLHIFSLRFNLGWIRKDFDTMLLLYFQFVIYTSYAIVISTIISKFLSKIKYFPFFTPPTINFLSNKRERKK